MHLASHIPINLTKHFNEMVKVKNPYCLASFKDENQSERIFSTLMLCLSNFSTKTLLFISNIDFLSKGT